MLNSTLNRILGSTAGPISVVGHHNGSGSTFKRASVQRNKPDSWAVQQSRTPEQRSKVGHGNDPLWVLNMLLGKMPSPPLWAFRSWPPNWRWRTANSSVASEIRILIPPPLCPINPIKSHETVMKPCYSNFGELVSRSFRIFLLVVHYRYESRCVCQLMPP